MDKSETIFPENQLQFEPSLPKKCKKSSLNYSNRTKWDKSGNIELEVVTRYAEKIGFQSHIVNDLLKTIVTAPYDGFDFKHVKEHLQEILENGKI
jgi:hypothetical protein